MRWTLALILFLFCEMTYSQSNLFPSGFSYQPSLQNRLPLRRWQNALDQIFENQDLMAFRQTALTTISRDGLDQVYSNAVMDKAVFIKFGVRPRDDKYLNQILSHPDGFLFHFLTPDQVPVAAFFYAVPEQTRNGMLAEIRKKFSLGNKSASHAGGWLNIAKLAVSKAEAAPACESTAVMNVDYSNYTSVVRVTAKKSKTNTFGSCMMNAWDSIKTSSLKKMANVTDFFDDLLTDPMAAWHSVKNSFSNLADFANNFKKKMSAVLSGFPGLAKGMEVDLWCTLVGELAPDLVLLLAGGYGAAKLTLAVAQYAQRVASVAKFLNYASKVPMTDGGEGVPEGFLKRLIRGEITPTQMKAIDKLTERGAPELARGAAACVP